MKSLPPQRQFTFTRGSVSVRVTPECGSASPTFSSVRSVAEFLEAYADDAVTTCSFECVAATPDDSGVLADQTVCMTLYIDTAQYEMRSYETASALCKNVSHTSQDNHCTFLDEREVSFIGASIECESVKGGARECFIVRMS